MEKSFTQKPRAKSVSIVNVDHPQRVVMGQEAEIRVSIAAAGMQGRTVGVELWRDGRKQHEMTVAFNEQEQTREAAFTVTHDKAGVVQYEAKLAEAAADQKTAARPFLIEVMEPGTRVIYLQNALGFDFKFLRKALVSDRNLQLSAFVRWADNRIVSFGDQGPGLGKSSVDFSRQSLANCSVVMLGDLPPGALSADDLKGIRDFVDKGGGLVLLGGPNSLVSLEFDKPPLGELLPVKIGSQAEYLEGNFPIEITQNGLRHPVFGPLFAKVKEFPPLLTCNVVESMAPTAEVLMQTSVNGRTCPLIVSRRFGQGRVVVVLTDTIWRWRLAAKSWSSERSPYETFWAQLMDRLINKEQTAGSSDKIDLFTERFNYILGERPEIRAVVRMPSPEMKQPATLPLQIRTPDDKVFEYTMRPAKLRTGGGGEALGYQVEVEPNMAGVFRATATAAAGSAKIIGETRFVVSRPVTELTGKPVNRDLLKRFAEASHGKFYSVDEWNGWRKDLHFNEQHFSRVQLLDLWNNPLLLGFLMLVLTLDWILRKKWNLP
jgi:hypothetical protein